jgi:hypothetical protein
MVSSNARVSSNTQQQRAGQRQYSAATRGSAAMQPGRNRKIGNGHPLRARGSFQRLVGNRVGEDIFVGLVEVVGLLVRGASHGALRNWVSRF